MRTLPHPFRLDTGFGPGVPASIGAAQRASLCRGVAFALLLAATSLASVYLPLACHGPDWVEGTAPPR